MNYFLILLVLLLLWLLLFPRLGRSRRLKNRKKKGGRPVPIELLRECIGKVCSITMMNTLSGCNGKITSIQDNWLRVEIKKDVRFLNCDMVQEIQILPEKYQK